MSELTDTASDLSGRTAIVVGASAGIGRWIAHDLTAMGASVGWCGRRGDVLTEVVEASGATGTAITADITSEEGCAAIARAAADLGPVDLVVVASGASAVRMLRDADLEWWDQLLRTNVIGPSLVVKHLFDHLAPGAVVAMLSSESVGQPYAGLVPYAASKAALEESIRGWRAEHPDVRFSRITVGATVGTEFTRDFDLDLMGELFPRWIKAQVIPSQPMEAEELGSSIARTLGHAVLLPGIDVQDLVLRSPGPPMDLPDGAGR